MPPAAHFPMILTELRRQRRNYNRKKFYEIVHRSPAKTTGGQRVARQPPVRPRPQHCPWPQRRSP
jgi:hypothetical protein